MFNFSFNEKNGPKPIIIYPKINDSRQPLTKKDLLSENDIEKIDMAKKIDQLKEDKIPNIAQELKKLLLNTDQQMNVENAISYNDHFISVRGDVYEKSAQAIDDFFKRAGFVRQNNLHDDKSKQSNDEYVIYENIHFS